MQMQKRLYKETKEGGYASQKRFQDDIRLVFDNALSYNEGNLTSLIPSLFLLSLFLHFLIIFAFCHQKIVAQRPCDRDGFFHSLFWDYFVCLLFVLYKVLKESHHACK